MFRSHRNTPTVGSNMCITTPARGRHGPAIEDARNKVRKTQNVSCANDFEVQTGR